MVDSGKGAVKTSEKNSCGTVEVDGNFAFQIQSDFRKAYEDLAKSCKSIKIDLNKAQYMDSSGLGMLLVMKKFLDGAKINYEIVRARGQTYELLKMTHFTQHFKINSGG